MSQSIQSWQPRQAYQQVLAGDELLRSELGWKEVASGLAKILYGYCLILVVGLIFIVMTLLLAYFTAPPARGQSAVPIQRNIAMWWTLGLGLGSMFLLSLYTYIQIFVGKVRCAIHAPERCGARWFIFACILTIVVGPVLSTIESVSAQINAPSAAKQEEELRQLQRQLGSDGDMEGFVGFLRGRITVTQIVGALVSMGTSVFFVLFLRAIGNCFEESRLTVMADLYLMFSALLMGFTIFLVFFAGFNRSTLLIAGVLGLGGLISLAWYFGLIVYTRCLILNRIASLRSPLDMY